MNYFKSSDCSSNLHDFCNTCTCECHGSVWVVFCHHFDDSHVYSVHSTREKAVAIRDYLNNLMSRKKFPLNQPHYTIEEHRLDSEEV